MLFRSSVAMTDEQQAFVDSMRLVLFNKPTKKPSVPVWKDANGRPCVAIEWSSHSADPAATASCALAWGCTSTASWGGGGVYVMEQQCDLCADAAACNVAADCLSNQCTSSVCTSCFNSARDGGETDVDCGGSICEKRCIVGEECAADGDCGTGKCDLTLATPVCRTLTAHDTCTNGGQDGTETDVDCGGEWCREDDYLCALTKICADDLDCRSGQCRATAPSADLLCTSCTDTVKNGVETDVDCGGADCKGCGQGAACTGPSDCASLQCESNVCTSCVNQIKDGLETDVDCGDRKSVV